MTITELTNQIFDASGLKNTQIANRIGVKRQLVTNYRKGYHLLRYERLMEIAGLLDVRVTFAVEKIDLFL